VLEYRITVILKIGSLLFEEVTAPLTLSEIKADAFYDFLRELTGSYERPIVFERDPAAVK
jgi:hypothetical protein